MDTRLQPVGETSARFAEMEKSAGVVFGAVLVSSAACVALFRPNLWFIFGSVLAGGAVYWCWRATLAKRFEMAAVAAVGAVAVALLAVAPEFSRPLPVLLSSGMSLLGVALYASILIGRTFKRNAKYEA
ncbi:MAG: hypothetical protein ACT6Q9_02855 [Polaromonas sp.]|uniref:hypothetical protein n=1 Tax=Polaromonas sp. TaxID=1869339 RepID=UPI004035B63C